MSACVAMSSIAMVRDVDVSMSTLCLKLKVLQKSVLRRDIDSVPESIYLWISSRSRALRCFEVRRCESLLDQLVETKLLARVA